jgi:hypothetical protein
MKHRYLVFGFRLLLKMADELVLVFKDLLKSKEYLLILLEFTIVLG